MKPAHRANNPQLSTGTRGDSRSWLDRLQAELNAEQYQFVTGESPVILGVAGPGSGKTRALTYRVAHLIQKGVSPENILLVTFTNKAAEEMRSRVNQILGFFPQGLWAGTFHSTGARILRQHAALVQRTPGFSILDQGDAEALLKSAFSSLKIALNPQEKNLFVKRGLLQKIISSAKNSCLDLETYLEAQMPHLVDYLPLVRKVAEAYEAKKSAANVFDFDDLLVTWLALLEENEPVRKHYQEKFQHILVDEFQDTNAVQDRLVLLLGDESAICLVGDDAQSIYSFRCAEVGNILNLPRKKPGCSIIKLVQNYRSIPEILELANCSIRLNEQQIVKELYAQREPGEKPWFFLARDNIQEANRVADKIIEHYNNGQDLQDMAVLYRSSFLSQDLELALMKRNVPYLTFGGLKFLQRAHIKDVMAWLKILENPRDELSWQRVAVLHEGIGEATFSKTWEKLRAFPNPLQAVLEERVTPGRGREGWSALTRTLKELAQADQGDVPGLIRMIMNSTYQQILQTRYPDDYTERSLGIERLAAYGQRCSSLGEFLESLALEEALILDSVKAASRERDFLTLSTIHSAKGKEWRTVFLIGNNEGQFPSPLGQKNLEEERRLFYVAITRAKDYLYLTASEENFRGWERYVGGPSQFVRELPLHCYQLMESDDHDLTW